MIACFSEMISDLTDMSSTWLHTDATESASVSSEPIFGRVRMPDCTHGFLNE